MAGGAAGQNTSPQPAGNYVAPTAQNDFYTAKENEPFDQALSATRFQAVSQPGDPIGGGQTYFDDTTSYVFSVTRNAHNGVSVSASSSVQSPPGGTRHIPGSGKDHAGHVHRAAPFNEIFTHAYVAQYCSRVIALIP